MSNRLPNFMIIGAMKSGTTSLWQYLNANRAVFMTEFKEPGFFVEELNWNRGWSWYEDHFAPVVDQTALGEASTHYTKAPNYAGVPERIAEHFPDMRFIYLMRTPVQRTISHYWHAVNYNDETRSVSRAIRNDPQYVDFSRYAMQLELYFKHFARDQFYITTFERMKADSETVVKECLKFIGVEDDGTGANLGETFNAGPKTVRRTRPLMHRIRWSKTWDRIAPLVPQGIKDFAKGLEHTSGQRNTAIPDDLRAHLESIFAEENEHLFELLGHRFAEWDATEARQKDKEVNQEATG